MSTPVGIIRKFTSVIANTLADPNKTGTQAVDAAMQSIIGTQSSYSAFQSEFNSARNSSSSNQYFLEQVCGVRLNNTDSGAITGSDAGGKVTKTDQSVVPEAATAKELSAAEYNSFTKNGLKVNVSYLTKTDDQVKSSSYAEQFNYSGETYLAKQKLVVRALYNWWIPEALDMINEVLGVNFTDGKANINELNIKFYETSSSYKDCAIENTFSYDMGLASSMTLKINANLLYNMTKDDKDGTLPVNGYIYSNDFYGNTSNYFTNYLDRLVLNAMAEIALKANIPYVTKLPYAIRAGLVEVIGGFDSDSIGDNNKYYNFAYNDSQDVGYTYMRYLAKKYSDGLPDGLSYNAEKTILTVTDDYNEDTIDLEDFESTIKTVDTSSRTKGLKIVGNELNNSILGGKGNDSLAGGKGADTLHGGKGNDTLTGGAGTDLFIYSGGNDVITDYNVSDDMISLGAAVDKATISGNDAVLTVGTGTLTVKNGKGKKLSITTDDGTILTTVIGGMILDNSSASKVTLGTGIEFADATARTTAINIVGNSLNNSIVGGYGNDQILGGAGADTLWGGSGNDTLYGQSGNDVFIYSAGKDVIADYAVGDKISLGAAISKATVSGSDVVFTIGSNTLTVKNGRDKTLSLITSAGKSITTVLGGDESLILTNSDDAQVAMPSDIQVADATKRTKAITIIGNKLNNTILGGSSNDLLSSGAGTDFVKGGAGNDKIWGGAGIDTLWGETGNDTLSGGAGNDIFIYSAGNDVITDYAVGDKISLGAAVTKTELKGADVVFTIGTGSLTVKNAKGKKISMVDAAGKNTSTIVSGLILDDSSAAKISLPTTLESANASARTTAIQINGNALDNSLTGGKNNDTILGGAGNDSIVGNAGDDKLYGGTDDDTLVGGAGNDSLWGQDGADTFVYSSGGGKDVIYGFEDIDMLEITGSFTTAYSEASKALYFKVGSTAGAITLKNVTATVFNINGDNYQLSGNTLVKK